MIDLSLGNLVSWAVQVAAVGLAGVSLPLALRVTAPKARLVYLNLVLVACLALPLVQPWVPRAVPIPVAADAAAGAADEALLSARATDPSGSRAGVASTPAAGTPSAKRTTWATWASAANWPIERVIGGAYLGGLTLRLAWFGLGLVMLSRLRRSSSALAPRPATIDDAALLVGAEADFRVSTRVVRPVTFGLRHPVVLVPSAFLGFEPAQQIAVAAHELLHVARRDWVRTIGDELLLSVFWFHPAMWWLLEQIHLSVEQVVDSAVVRLVGARKPYLEALLKLAAAGPTPILQPAAAFLKHGHLAQRVALLVREASMSRVRLAASFALVLMVLLTGGWFVVQAFPLTASLQIVALPAVAPPASFERIPPPPPPPPPPAPPSKQSTVAPVTQQVRPGLPPVPPPPALPSWPPPPPPPPPPPGATVYSQPYDTAAWEKVVQALTVRVAAEPNVPEMRYTLAMYYWERVYRDTSLSERDKRTYLAEGLQSIDVALGLKPEYYEAVTCKSLLLTVQSWLEQDPAKKQALMAQVVRLRAEAARLMPPATQGAWTDVPAGAVRVGGGVVAPIKLKDVKPVYPAVAQNARVQGIVIVEIVISPNGTVQAARVLRSIPLLDRAAIEAVSQWEFRPTLQNGVAIPIVMTCTVNFTLGDGTGSGSGIGVGVGGGVGGGVAGGVPGGVTGGLAGSNHITGILGGSSDEAWSQLIAGAVRVGGNVPPPAKTKDVKPVYPAEAQAAGVQGVVIIEAVITPNGTVAGARILRSIPLLNQAALDAVSQWVFTPPLLNGVPVSAVITLTVNFTLQ